MEQDELLNTLLTCAQQVVRAEGAGLTLYDDQKDVLIFRAATGVAADKIVGMGGAAYQLTARHCFQNAPGDFINSHEQGD